MQLKKVFLNEKLILFVVLINSVVLFLEQCRIENQLIMILDLACTVIFLLEMIYKHIDMGFRKYWSNGWNIMDGTLVLLSLPSVIAIVFPIQITDLSFLLILRILRIFRFFRLVHFFPRFGQIMKNFGLAMRQSWGVLLGIFIMILTFAMIGCGLFSEAVPEYFGTPLNSIYSTFRVFTGEGWNEIPDTIAEAMGPAAGHWVKLYFSVMLILGCIIAMSLLNSIFVDAMVSDNNDDLKDRLDKIEEKIDKLSESQKKDIDPSL